MISRVCLEKPAIAVAQFLHQYVWTFSSVKAIDRGRNSYSINLKFSEVVETAEKEIKVF